MKLNKMIAYCKKAAKVHIYTDGYNKYLSDGIMMMRLEQNSTIDINNIFEYMDVKEDNKEKFDIANVDITEHFETYIEPSTRAEQIERLPIGISTPDQMSVFRTSKGLLMVDRKRLDIFNDIGIRDYYLSEYGSSPCLLIVKDRVVYGMIMPIEYDFEKLEAILSVMVTQARTAANNGFNSTGHQMSLDD